MPAELLPTPWIMKTVDGYFYPIQPSAACKPEDHGRLNPHVRAIEDIDGNVLWERRPTTWAGLIAAQQEKGNG